MRQQEGRERERGREEDNVHRKRKPVKETPKNKRRREVEDPHRASLFFQSDQKKRDAERKVREEETRKATAEETRRLETERSQLEQQV
jgi:hypothetical protein